MKIIIGYILYISGLLAAIALHFYTVYWIYESNGIGWAFVSFCTPPFSELIVIGASINAYGWTNLYLIGWVVTSIAFKTGQIILETSAENSNAS